MADRLFVPALGNCGAHRAPDRLGNLVGIAQPRFRQRRERLFDGIAGDLFHRPAAGISVRNADQLDLRVGHELAFFA